MVSAGIMGTKISCIGSHEGAGTVVELGSSVTDVKKGDRLMAGLPRNRCGHCTDCLGDENYRQYCPNLAGHVGVTLDGAFAEYMVVDGRESPRIPDEVSFETAAERNPADRIEERRDSCDCRRWGRPRAFGLPVCKSARTNGCRN